MGEDVAPRFGTASWLYAIAHSSAGHTYLTGTSIQGNVFIQKYSIDGGLLWSRRLATIAPLSTALELSGHGISLDSAGNAYVAGTFSSSIIFGPGEPNETTLTTTSGNFDFDIFLAKYLNDTPVQNVPPVANNQVVTTPEDTALSITLTATDADGDTLTYSIVTGPAHGELSGAPPDLIYTPHQNYHGRDSFTFRAFDGTDSDEATVTITVSPVNDRPVAQNQTVSTPQNMPVAITLAGSDVHLDSLTYSVVDPPTHGALSGTAPGSHIHAATGLRRS